MERITQEADFGLEDWEETLFFVKSDPNGAYNILDIAKYQGESEFDEILKNVALRLAAYEDTGLEPETISKIRDIVLDISGNLDRLRELAQADREGRCVVLPFKPPKRVYMCSKRFPEPAEAYYASAVNVLSEMERGCVFGDTPEQAKSALNAREQND